MKAQKYGFYREMQRERANRQKVTRQKKGPTISRKRRPLSRVFPTVNILLFKTRPRTGFAPQGFPLNLLKEKFPLSSPGNYKAGGRAA